MPKETTDAGYDAADGKPQWVRYLYDGLGRRVARYYGPGASYIDWPKVRIVHDGVEPVSEFKFDNGALYERCYYEGLARPYMVDNGLIGVAGCGLLLTDDRGSVAGVVDWYLPGPGWEQLYYNTTGLCRSFKGAFLGGGEHLRTDDPDYNLGRSGYVPFGYLGMYHDPFTGLYHTHFREYDAMHGRWLSEDPAGYADGLNLYQAYMGVNGTDPLGLDIWDDEIASIRRGNTTWGNRGLQKFDRGAVVAGHAAKNIGRGIVEPVVVVVDAATNTTSALTGSPLGTNYSMTFESGGLLDQYGSIKREALASGATPWEAGLTASVWSAGEVIGTNNMANAVQGEKITFNSSGNVTGQDEIGGWGRALEGAEGVGKFVAAGTFGGKVLDKVGDVADTLTDAGRVVNKVDNVGDAGKAGRVAQVPGASIGAANRQEVRFYKSFGALKKDLGPAGQGKVWHHIVEQRQVNRMRFGEEAIHNTTNVVSVPRGVNQAIANYYSTKQSFTRGLTVRDWLHSQSWRDQFEFGQNVLNLAQSGQPLPR